MHFSSWLVKKKVLSKISWCTHDWAESFKCKHLLSRILPLVIISCHAIATINHGLIMQTINQLTIKSKYADFSDPTINIQLMTYHNSWWITFYSIQVSNMSRVYVSKNNLYFWKGRFFFPAEECIVWQILIDLALPKAFCKKTQFKKILSV